MMTSWSSTVRVNAQAQERDNRHQDQQSDGNSKYLDPDGNSQGRSNRRKAGSTLPPADTISGGL